MTQQYLLYVGLGLLVGAIGLASSAIYINRKLNQRTVIRSQNSVEKVGRLYLVLYRWLSKNPLTKQSIFNIRSRIEIIGNSNERAIRKKVIQIYTAIILLLSVLFIAVILITKQVLMVVLFMVVLWFLSETLVEFFVIRLKNRLLKQQIKFNDFIRHKYYETGMVDEAIYQACQSLDQHHYEIGLQGQRIHDVLMSKDVEKEMVTYNDTAPNKFLKMLLGLAYMSMEYGDTHNEGVSVFMRNMSDLTSEIRIELTKRERLNYALKSLNFIVLAPLFFITPIRNWASGYFVPLKTFYESQTGFFLEMMTLMLIFGSYVLLRRIQKFDENRLGNRKKPFEQSLYEKGLYPLIDKIKPSKKRYFHVKRQLKAIASPLTVEAFSTRKFLAFVTGLVLALVFFMALHYNQRHQVLVSPTLPDQFLGGQLSKEELENAKVMTETDNKYLSQMTQDTSLEEVLLLLEDKGLPIETSKIMAQRLMNKKLILYDQYIKWWEISIMLAFALISYQLPRAYLHFQEKVIKIDLEDEVAGYGSIILMLMHHERIAVVEVLEWMEMYSTFYKEPLGDCLNNAAAGMSEALEGLKDATTNERFINIIESLILASEDITIRQAFDELASEKTFYTEERKETNNRIVEKKINIGRMIGFAPLYGLIVLYMIVPMITASVTDMQQYFNQISL